MKDGVVEIVGPMGRICIPEADLERYMAQDGFEMIEPKRDAKPAKKAKKDSKPFGGCLPPEQVDEKQSPLFGSESD